VNHREWRGQQLEDTDAVAHASQGLLPPRLPMTIA